MIQSVDHVALLPAYLVAGTTVLVFLLDLVLAPTAAGRRHALLGVAALGVVGTGVASIIVATGPVRATFCLPGDTAACSYVADQPGAVVAVLFCVLTLGVLALSAPSLATSPSGPPLPSGEYVFLLLCSLTGAVVLGYSRDLITLLVAVETLTLPLYALVGMRRRELASLSGAVNFFLISVVSTSITLMGAALLYALTGAVHLNRLAEAFAGREELRTVPLAAVAAVLVVAGLSFKVAAVPFHAWAPGTYDGAPLPIAGYLSTASKLGGVIALLYVVVGALRPWLDVVGPALAGLAVLTMSVGNLVALRQTRIVRLLAWSSVAQAGYILAPLGGFAVAAGRASEAVPVLVAATVGYASFYVLIELAAFGCLVALRGAGDGGPIEDYRGVARRAPWLAAGLGLALAGLAGLPPGFAGLFAKAVVVRALLEAGGGWLALVVALNAVVGLAYYVRLGAVLYAPAERPPAPSRRVAWPVGFAVVALTLAGLLVGFAPQLVLDAADAVALF